MDETELESLHEEAARGRLANHELSLTRDLLAKKRGELVKRVLSTSSDDAKDRDMLIWAVNFLDALPQWLEAVMEQGEAADTLINIILEKRND